MIDFKSDSVKNLLLSAIVGKGYKEDAKKTSKRHRVFKDGSNDTVIVSSTSNFQLYFNPEIAEDKGDVIRFLLNRAGIGINCRNDLKTYYRQIESELAKLGANHFVRTYALVDKKTFHWGAHKPFVSDFGEKVPGNILALLANRCIDPSILFDADLQPVQQYMNNRTGYSNIFFPFRDICGNIAGGQVKYLKNKSTDTNVFVYETVKMNLPDSERERSLWYTAGTGKDSLFVAEDPLDAISYHLLYQRKEKLQYVATGGSITANQISQIQKMAFGRQLILGNDADFSGMFANLSIIEGKPVNRTMNQGGTVDFKIDGEGELNMNFPELKKFVTDRAKKSNIEVVIPSDDDWNEELKQKKKPSQKLADAAHVNFGNHAGKVTQRADIHKYI